MHTLIEFKCPKHSLCGKFSPTAKVWCPCGRRAIALGMGRLTQGV